MRSDHLLKGERGMSNLYRFKQQERRQLIRRLCSDRRGNRGSDPEFNDRRQFPDRRSRAICLEINRDPGIVKDNIS